MRPLEGNNVRSGSNLWRLSGLVGLMVSGGAFVISWGGDVPTVGLVEPVYAAAPEHVELRELARNQTLGDLLAGVLDANQQYSLILALRERANPRRMRAGTEVAFRWLKGDPPQLRAVDIALNADETVRLAPTVVGWSSELITTPVLTDTVWASGEIASSLWNAVVANESLDRVDPKDRAKLILELDDVFKWQVDFVRQIQEGDFYRFSFEREVRPDGSMRMGHVLSAELVNRGRRYTALWFDPNGDGDGTYYDLDGNSVRRAFLRSPIALRHRISGRFTNSRFHPILQRWRAHRGVDYAANSGTPIQATGNGVVVRRERESTYGNLIEIRHPNGWSTRYAHMSGFTRSFGVGSRVKQGDIIGYVGMTGLATGPHLHYEMRIHGAPEDPLSIDLPAGDPVPGDYWDVWEIQSRARLALLDRLPLPWDVRLAVNVLGDDVASNTGAR